MPFCDEGYVGNQKAQQAIDIFFQIAKPGHLSFMLLFNACAQLANEKALAFGEQISSRCQCLFSDREFVSV